jgi:Flp pilus assembly protein TadD
MPTVLEPANRLNKQQLAKSGWSGHACRGHANGQKTGTPLGGGSTSVFDTLTQGLAMFLKRFFKFIPKNDYSRALDLFNEGFYKKALKIFDDLLERRDTDDELDIATVELFACESHVALSKERMNEGNLEGALEEQEMAVALKPNFADLRYTLGHLYMEAGRHENAKVNFQKALDINPKFFKAGINLARALFVSGDQANAVESLHLAQGACPNFYSEKLADLIQMLRMGSDPDAVRHTFHEILEERPSSAQISREVAIEAIQNGNYNEAIRELKKAIALKPDYPDLHNYLGIAYGNSGMADDAIEEFEVSLKINPYYLKARLNLALAQYDAGRFIEAQNHIERVLSVQPDNQLAKNLLAELRTVADKR